MNARTYVNGVLVDERVPMQYYLYNEPITDIKYRELMDTGKYRERVFLLERRVRLVQIDETKLLKAKQNELRQKRKPLLEAFDKWEKAVLRGREEDDTIIMNWYNNLLNLVETAFDNIPERIKYYL